MVPLVFLVLYFYFGSSKQVTQAKSKTRDNSLVREAVCKSSENGKKRKKNLRFIKKGYSDIQIKKKKEKVDSCLASGYWGCYVSSIYY